MTDARASGSGEPGFDEIYARAGSDLNAIPWAALAPQPALVAWLDRQDRHSPPDRQDQLRPPGRQDRHSPPGRHGQPDPQAPERTALIVACGLGDDAEEVSRRGYQVTAFDLVPAAIGHCRERFPGRPSATRSRTSSGCPAAGAARLTWWWRSGRCSRCPWRSARMPPPSSRARCGPAAGCSCTAWDGRTMTRRGRVPGRSAGGNWLPSLPPGCARPNGSTRRPAVPRGGGPSPPSTPAPERTSVQDRRGCAAAGSGHALRYQDRHCRARRP